jgi:ubiquinol-cytochrome c reductase cytochrome c1 subunit
MTRKRLFAIALSLCSFVAIAAEEGPELRHATVDINDQAALQRGAKNFMNFCSGCHSLQYLRYNRMAEDLGIVDQNGVVEEELLKTNLIFTSAKVVDLVTVAMPAADAKGWFGITPPDLSLVARERGADWIFTYLTSFYQDDARIFGVNNLLKPNVSMPNVLASLQGSQIPVYKETIMHLEGGDKTIRTIDHLQRMGSGLMNEQEFDSMVNDLVTFLVYVGEPVQAERETLGWWVLGYLVVFAFILYMLKRNFWHGIKK